MHLANFGITTTALLNHNSAIGTIVLTVVSSLLADWLKRFPVGRLFSRIAYLTFATGIAILLALNVWNNYLVWFVGVLIAASLCGSVYIRHPFWHVLTIFWVLLLIWLEAWDRFAFPHYDPLHNLLMYRFVLAVPFAYLLVRNSKFTYTRIKEATIDGFHRYDKHDFADRYLASLEGPLLSKLDGVAFVLALCSIALRFGAVHK